MMHIKIQGAGKHNSQVAEMTKRASEQTLEQLYAKHRGKVSDKWSIYLSEYDRLFQPHRSLPIRLLEIGIQNGGSLEIWSKFFPKAEKIVGCDINPDCAQLTYKDPRIRLVVGDANSDEAQAAVLSHSATFDLIIDDGSHQSSDIVKSFARYFPRLVEGGIFVAEDLHCSYWKQFEGGLFDPFSSMAFLKRLADVINHEHWGVEKATTEIFAGFFARYGFHIDAEILSHIHSVEFINSMCVIRKLLPEQNVLGPRFISGLVERVVPGHLGLHMTQATPLYQRDNPWAVRNTPPEEELSLRLQELAERDGRISGLAETIAENQKQIDLLQDRREFINELRQTVAAKDEHIRKLDLLVHAHAQGVADREQQVVNLNLSISARQIEYDSLSAMLVEKNTASAETEARLNELNHVVGEHVSQIASLTQIVSNREGHIAALTQGLSTQDEQLAVLYQSVAKLQSQNSALADALSEQTDRLQQIILEGQGRFSTLVQSLVDRDGEVQKLTQMAVTREEHARLLEISASELGTKFAKLTRSIEARDEHIGRLIQSMAVSERQMGALHRDKAGLEGKISALDGTAVEQDLRIVAMTSAISAEQAKVAVHEQSIGARVAHITALNQELDGKVSQIMMLQQEIESREARKLINVVRTFFRGK